MNQTVRAFRKQAEQENQGRSGVRRRYSAGLRGVAVSYCRQKRQEGWSLHGVAEELGVNAWSLSRWMEQAGAKGRFRPVEVVSERERSERGMSLVLVTPEGFRVEGVDEDGVRRLLQVLR